MGQYRSGRSRRWAAPQSPSRVGAIETGRRHQDAGGDERRQQRPPRDGGRARPRNGGEREQALVGGGLDDLVTVEPEGEEPGRSKPPARWPRRGRRSTGGVRARAVDRFPRVIEAEGQPPLRNPVGASNAGRVVARLDQRGRGVDGRLRVRPDEELPAALLQPCPFDQALRLLLQAAQDRETAPFRQPGDRALQRDQAGGVHDRHVVEPDDERP